MTFFNFKPSMLVCWYSPRRIWSSKPEPFRVQLRSLDHVVPLSDGNSRHAMPVVRGPCARDLLRYTFSICVFNCGKCRYSAIKNANNEFVDFAGNYVVIYNINGRLNPTKMVKVIGMEDLVSHYRLDWTREYLTPGLCSLVKPYVMEKCISSPIKIPTVMLCELICKTRDIQHTPSNRKDQDYVHMRG